MKEEKKKLTIAEQEVVRQIRRWPTLYGSAHDFFHSCVVGRTGSYSWVKGRLVSSEKNYSMVGGKPRWTAYPFRVPQAYAVSMLNHNAAGFPSVSCASDGPVANIPDDAHKDWLKFISHHLYLDSKLTPELYDIVVQAHTVMHYGVTHNPHCSHDSYKHYWAEYFARIPAFVARIRLIEQTREQGKVPPDRYQGLDI